MTCQFSTLRNKIIIQQIFISALSKLVSLTPLAVIIIAIGILQVTAEKIELTAEKFVQLVKENAPSLQIDRIDPLVQEAILAENTKLAYNAPLTANYGNGFRLGDDGGTTTRLGINWAYTFSPASTKVNVGTSVASSKKANTSFSPTSGITTSFSTNWNSVIELGITQPLLYGGFAYFSGERQLDLQRYTTRISRSQYNTKLSQTLQNALSVYYGYLINKEMIKLSRRTLAEAKEILNFNEKKAQRRTLDRKDLLANRAQVYQSEINLANTEKALNELKDRLLNFLGYKNNDAVKHELIINDSTAITSPKYTFEKSYESAMQSRSELATLQYQLLASENAIKLGKSALFPRLDANFKMQMLGTGDNFNDPLPDTFANFKDNLNFEVGLQLLVYTDILSYKVTTARANLQKLQTIKRISQLKEELSINVKQAIKNIQNLYVDVTKRSRILKLQQERFTISKKDYFNGKIDFSQYKSIQIDLTTAQINYLSTKLQYLNSLISLQATDGSLLGNFTINALDADEELNLNNVTDYVKSNSDAIKNFESAEEGNEETTN